ncbi:TetR/AcrR family transcriptional regulator [Streptomyces klenkii]|uniref:TetR/AcrR family transcriptional regulator n=1 Tax=Streptomyces klenkii TaxID=1420899 RepID=A0A3B0BWE1_9ACTN|nr:TetR/AcrR family transcriptional regulator [Streptomyces klenkii]RKN76711.1 TetR/AcrR family transcriptional regulator [Streptomyces klenkii]
MGHREDLLEGAKRCLLDKGWTRTTARDIVAASGANLASIGYHYGSKDALMMEAFLQLTVEWADGAAPVIASAADPDAPREERLAATLDRVSASFANDRAYWSVQMEVIGQLVKNAELREKFAAVQSHGREGMVALFEGVDDSEVGPEATRTAGAFYHALFVGLWMQWLIDPAAAPTGKEIVEGARRALAGTVLNEQEGTGR